MADKNEKLTRKQRKQLKKFQKRKKKGVVDKLVMGAIVGGAIGSVVGLTVAPKKGKETREYLKGKSKEVYDKGKEVSEKLMDEYGDDLQAAKEKTKSNGKKVWGYFKKKLLKRK
jgi:gas vesicle protein